MSISPSESTPTKQRATVERKSDCEVVISRIVDGPARLVFEAWTTSSLFARWWVPKSMPLKLLSCELDVRVGGGYRLVFDRGDGQTMAFFGTYLEVVPDARLVWTNEESGEDGPVTTMTLEEHGGKTRVVVIDRYRSKEVCDAGLASGAYDGMGETFDQLDELLVTLAAR